jgi:preprotein translocase subunit SecG
MSLLFWTIFLLSSIFMVFIILLQEPKGGGLAEAFGGMGAETFGVKTGGVNRLTLTVAGFWVGSAVMLQLL